MVTRRLRRIIRRMNIDSDAATGVIVLLLLFLFLFFGGFWYLLASAVACFILYEIFHIKVLLTAMYILIGIDAFASGVTVLLIMLGLMKD